MTDLFLAWMRDNLGVVVLSLGGPTVIVWKVAPAIAAAGRAYLKERKTQRDARALKAKEAEDAAAKAEQEWRREVINQGQVMAAWAKTTDQKMALFQETLRLHDERTLTTASTVQDVRESVARIEGFIRGMSGAHGPTPTPPHPLDAQPFGKPRSHT